MKVGINPGYLKSSRDQGGGFRIEVEGLGNSTLIVRVRGSPEDTSFQCMVKGVSCG